MPKTKPTKKKKPAKRSSVEECRVIDQFDRIVMDNIPVSVITIDKQGYITSANKYFENYSRIKNYRRHNIFKDKFFLRENLADDYRRLFSEGKSVRRDHFFEKDSQGKGEDRYFNIIAVPFRNKIGEIEGAVSMAVDSTDAVISKNKLLELNDSLEEKVRQRTEDLNRANTELKKAIELKSIFIADVSHEFRTSLTIMQCSLELLSKSCDGKKENIEMFDNIVTEIKRVSSMLANLALLTKSDSVAVKTHYVKVDLNQAIATICRELGVVAAEKNVLIEHTDSPLDAVIMADKDDIEKLLLNLIRNAIKYNKDNGWIKVWIEKAEGGVNIKVKDSGIGIPENELSNIFERFYRVDKSRTRNGHDSGLGLAICKHIVETHGGKISVESKLGKGTTFTVYLPADSRK